MDSQFPSWAAMMSIDILLILLAVSSTLIVVARWKALKDAQAILGVSLILAGLWTGASLYIADLCVMIALPAMLGMADAMAAMRTLHLEHSWYINATSAVLTFLGLGMTILRLVRQLLLTERAKAEAETQSSQKSAFLASMSHELRTPLNAVIGFAQMLQLEPMARDRARVREYSKNIESSGELLSELVNDLLDLSRIEAGRLNLMPTLIELPVVVLGAANSLEGLARQAGVEFSSEVKGGASRCFADRRAVEQITINVLANAIRHTPEGGSIRLTIECLDPHGVRLRFADTGTGIPPEELPYLFEPFVHADPMTTDTRRGQGLGLAICKRLVDAHDGSITVDSTVGVGTEITIEFPARQRDEPADRVPARAA